MQPTKVAGGVSAKTKKPVKGAVAEALIIAVINKLGRNLTGYGLSQFYIRGALSTKLIPDNNLKDSFVRHDKRALFILRKRERLKWLLMIIIKLMLKVTW